ncbi:MAG TPA: SIS domain-containing protein [Vicinamibacterales bacterium]|nr:SIS domain-containing protein [Vicinamibacterales bacterium]
MTEPDRAGMVADLFADSAALHQRVAAGLIAPILAAADAIGAALGRGGKVLVFGNGGSAADAQHLAAELVGRFERERPALAAVALTTDTSILTSIGNDYAFERVFERQIEALGRPGDVAIGISTSGGSPNVVRALARATQQGLTTVAITGRDGGAAGAGADIHLNVPHPSTARVQEVHRTVIHAVCALVEQGLRPSAD